MKRTISGIPIRMTSVVDKEKGTAEYTAKFSVEFIETTTNAMDYSEQVYQHAEYVIRRKLFGKLYDELISVAVMIDFKRDYEAQKELFRICRELTSVSELTPGDES